MNRSIGFIAWQCGATVSRIDERLGAFVNWPVGANQFANLFLCGSTGHLYHRHASIKTLPNRCRVLVR